MLKIISVRPHISKRIDIQSDIVESEELILWVIDLPRMIDFLKPHIRLENGIVIDRRNFVQRFITTRN